MGARKKGMEEERKREKKEGEVVVGIIMIETKSLVFEDMAILSSPPKSNKLIGEKSISMDIDYVGYYEK